MTIIDKNELFAKVASWQTKNARCVTNDNAKTSLVNDIAVMKSWKEQNMTNEKYSNASLIFLNLANNQLDDNVDFQKIVTDDIFLQSRRNHNDSYVDCETPNTSGSSMRHKCVQALCSGRDNSNNSSIIQNLLIFVDLSYNGIGDKRSEFYFLYLYYRI